MGHPKVESCRRNIILKTFRELRCRCQSPLKNLISSSRNKKGSACRVAPEGCFTVYVGPEKQRFVVKTEHANHPLFERLLDEAACEYGFQRDGPILLPCNVDLFCRVLAEMDCSASDDGEITGGISSSTLEFGGRGYLSPARLWMWRRTDNQHDCQYSRLSPPRSLKLNQF